jgi:phosphohistidine phosphatase
MKTLYVLRHGHAAPESQAGDHQRPLTARGVIEARRSADQARRSAPAPSLVLSSSAVRAMQTAEQCMAALGGATQLHITDELYLAEPPSYLALLAQVADRHLSVMVVGHNPGLEALVHVLTDRSEHLPTASLVQIDLPIVAWTELSGSAPVEGQLVGAFRP